MAQIKILLQGLLDNHDHETAVKNLLTTKNASKFIISVAFARARGVRQLQAELSAVNSKIAMFIGIANGVTSVQAISELLHIGISPVLIDMGTNKRIYHPKVYACIGEDTAQVIMGSANLTYSGLNENVEASTVLTLDKSDAQDLAFFTSLESTLDSLNTNYPHNVFKINNQSDLKLLLDEGRLEDESIKRAAVVTGHRNPAVTPRVIPNFPIKRRIVRTTSAPVVPSHPVVSAMGLVWRSKELTERDLSIPSGSNTNATGSMYLKKGLIDGIDQRHYFRDSVFNGLTWRPDNSPSKKHLHRAVANFDIVIDGISMGVFALKITHNTNTNSTTYKQNNAMTQIHWGPASNLVGRRDLLGKFLTIYHIGADNYQIEIN